MRYVEGKEKWKKKRKIDINKRSAFYPVKKTITAMLYVWQRCKKRCIITLRTRPSLKMLCVRWEMKMSYRENATEKRCPIYRIWSGSHHDRWICLMTREIKSCRGKKYHINHCWLYSVNCAVAGNAWWKGKKRKKKKHE